ncbi:hypothetical protein BHM03_00006594 [Ensete ventricosum]|nr:hypothetical protein BHM03_00006594 [Ensete ventricosum]
MEREATRYRYRVRGTGGGGGGGAVEPSPTNDTNSKGASASPELLLQWGNRKRLRCVKFQRRDDDAAPGLHSTTAAAAARVDRALRGATSTAYKRVLRYGSSRAGDVGEVDHVPSVSEQVSGERSIRVSSQSTSSISPILKIGFLGRGGHVSGKTGSLRMPQSAKHVSLFVYSRRNNSEATGVATRAKRGVSLPERERGGRGSACTEGTHENEGGGGGGGGRRGGSPSSGSEGAATIWPKFALALTNKEKEEDFFAFKGSKLPPRPKKRAKLLQRTINVSSLAPLLRLLSIILIILSVQ